MVRKSFSDDYQKLDMMLIIFKYFEGEKQGFKLFETWKCINAG